MKKLVLLLTIALGASIQTNGMFHRLPTAYPLTTALRYPMSTPTLTRSMCTTELTKDQQRLKDLEDLLPLLENLKCTQKEFVNRKIIVLGYPLNHPIHQTVTVSKINLKPLLEKLRKAKSYLQLGEPTVYNLLKSLPEQSLQDKKEVVSFLIKDYDDKTSGYLALRGPLIEIPLLNKIKSMITEIEELQVSKIVLQENGYFDESSYINNQLSALQEKVYEATFSISSYLYAAEL